MNDLEGIASKKNQIILIILNARENAVIFYKKLGYKIVKKNIYFI